MRNHFCKPDAWLVGASYWLPTDPFDFAWNLGNPAIGCNALTCHSCGEKVQAEVRDEYERVYRCRCQERIQTGRLRLGADEGQLNEFRNDWYCAGHPSLLLPTKLDGFEISADGVARELIASALKAPPFTPPGSDDPAFWIERLFSVLDDRAFRIRDQIGREVADVLVRADDAVAVRSALGFFWTLPKAPGGELLVGIARARREFFRMTPDPRAKTAMLESSLFDTLSTRAITTDDPQVIVFLRDTLLSGHNPADILISMGVCDANWLVTHAEELAKLRPDWIKDVVLAIRRASAPKVKRALLAIASIGPEAAATTHDAVIRYYTPQHFPSDVIEPMLAMLDLAKRGRR